MARPKDPTLKRKVQVGTRLDYDEYEWAKKFCKQNKVSLADFVRQGFAVRKTTMIEREEGK